MRLPILAGLSFIAFDDAIKTSTRYCCAWVLACLGGECVQNKSIWYELDYDDINRNIIVDYLSPAAMREL